MITNININEILPHPNNPRKELGDLSELSLSIKAMGILQNLTIVPNDAQLYQKQKEAQKPYTGKYTAIIGHRRLSAAKEAVSEMKCFNE